MAINVALLKYGYLDKVVLKRNNSNYILMDKHAPVTLPFLIRRVRTMSTSSRPVRIYLSPDKEKSKIINENKGKSGIYRWVHKNTGKSYIGSSTKLDVRFRTYYAKSHLSNIKRAKSIICNSLFKYGYAAFRLEILEYCPKNNLIEREQFYLDSFMPEYNILKTAGSLLGFKHMEYSKNLIKKAAIKRYASEEERNIKRKARLGLKLPRTTIENIALNHPLRQPVLLYNPETGDRKEFSSMSQAGLYLNVARITIKNHIKNNTPLKGYIATSASSKASKITSPSNLRQPILLTNMETGDIIKFSTTKAACEYLNIFPIRLWRYFNKVVYDENLTINGYKITKEYNYSVPVKNRSKAIEVTNIETNEITSYASLTLAAQSLSVSIASISYYLSLKRTTPLKGKYILKKI